MIYFIIFFINAAMHSLGSEANSLRAEKIVGGNLARVGQFKYHVSVQRNDKPKCGGGIIHDSYVATAAHCVIDLKTGGFKKNRLTIVAAAIDINNLDSMAVTIQVIMIFVPKDFKPSRRQIAKDLYLEGDIAILKLKHKLMLNLNSNLNKLETNQAASLKGESLVITGQGYHKMTMIENPQADQPEEVGESDGRLRFAYIKVVRHNKCKKVFKRYNEYSNICARVVQRSGDYPEGTCLGDSGSPLVYNGDIMTGILSTGTAKCVENKEPSAYTNVTHYSWFIESTKDGMVHPDVRFAVWKSKNFCCGKQEFIEDLTE